MGGDPLHGTGPRGFSVTGGTATDGAAPAAAGRREVVAHLGGGGDIGVGVGNDGDIHPEELEYSCAVHFYLIASRLL